MSTLSSGSKMPIHNTDRLGGNTLATIVIGFVLFCFIDFLRGVELKHDIMMVNVVGAFFIATPLMLIIAARNVGKWTVNEYAGLGMLVVMMAIIVGLPVLGMNLNLLHAGADEIGMSNRALARFEGMSIMSVIFFLAALGAFIFYGFKEKVWREFAQQTI